MQNSSVTTSLLTSSRPHTQGPHRWSAYALIDSETLLSDINSRSDETRLSGVKRYPIAVSSIRPFSRPVFVTQVHTTMLRGTTMNQIVQLFERLPGDLALSIYAPAVGDGSLRVRYNSSKMLFVASAFKAYALCAALRQVDAP